MLFLCYMRKGSVYMSVLAKTEAGFYQGIDPIAVIRASETAELRRAIAGTIARGNPVIPTPPPAAIPLPLMLKHAGVKTWKAFERGTSSWKIREKDGIYQIVGQCEGKYGGWVDDTDQTTTLPSGTSVDDVIERLIAILQAAAMQKDRAS